MYKGFISLLFMLVLTGCSFFQVRKPIIEQGNVITNENVSKRHSGMPDSQVVAIMGTPVLTNILTPDRMEYIYTYRDHVNPLIIKRDTCLFNGGRLKNIQKT